ncbi:MAG TPA: hypothetical protein VGL93_12130 [Streptosporangiaceae bacterium]|jgi:hypothetical protein
MTRIGSAEKPATRFTCRLITARLRRIVGYTFVRGVAHATGTGLAGLLFWWITHR